MLFNVYSKVSPLVSSAYKKLLYVCMFFLFYLTIVMYQGIRVRSGSKILVTVMYLSQRGCLEDSLLTRGFPVVLFPSRSQPIQLFITVSQPYPVSLWSLLPSLSSAVDVDVLCGLAVQKLYMEPSTEAECLSRS